MRSIPLVGDVGIVIVRAARPNIHLAKFFLASPTSTFTRRPSFPVVTIIIRSGISSTSISITSGFLFLVLVEGLAAKNEVMLDGFNDVIALDDMIGKLN